MENRKILELPNKDPHPDLKILLGRISSSMEKLDFGELSDKPDDKVNIGDMAVCVSEAIINSEHDFIKRGNRIHVYNGRYWEQIGDDNLKDFLCDTAIHCGVSRVNAKKVDFWDKLRTQFLHLLNGHVPRIELDVKINLKSGTYHIGKESREPQEFNKEDFLFYQLPFDYDPNAKCPLFDTYLDYCLDKDSHDSLYSFLAYAILGRQAPNIEKALFLEGDGGTGKSVIMNITRSLFGAENVSVVPLSKFGAKEGMYLQDMEGKLLNYASETGKNFAIEIFKQVVSKEPTVSREIYGKPRLIDDFPALIFNVNIFPRSKETTNAIYRRVIILVFDRVIPDQMKDTQLAKKIITSELPGIFNKIIEAIPVLLETEEIPMSEKSKSALSEYRELDDSIYSFLREKNYEPSNDQYKPFKELYTEYTTYCYDSGVLKMAKNKFSMLVKRMGYVVDSKRNRNIYIQTISEDEEPTCKDVYGNEISKEEEDRKLEELGLKDEQQPDEELPF